jgi:hypothetical protein
METLRSPDHVFTDPALPNPLALQDGERVDYGGVMVEWSHDNQLLTTTITLSRRIYDAFKDLMDTVYLGWNTDRMLLHRQIFETSPEMINQRSVAYIKEIGARYGSYPYYCATVLESQSTLGRVGILFIKSTFRSERDLYTDDCAEAEVWLLKHRDKPMLVPQTFYEHLRSLRSGQGE